MYRVWLILLLAIISTGCTSLRDNTPLLWRSRRAKAHAQQELEYDLFDEIASYDSEFTGKKDERDEKSKGATRKKQRESEQSVTEYGQIALASGQLDSSIVMARSRVNSSESSNPIREEELAHTARIINLIERTDDDELRRILAEKLPNTRGSVTREEQTQSDTSSIASVEAGETSKVELSEAKAAESLAPKVDAVDDPYQDVGLVVFADRDRSQQSASRRSTQQGFSMAAVAETSEQGEVADTGTEPRRLSYPQKAASAEARFVPAGSTTTRTNSIASQGDLPNFELRDSGLPSSGLPRLNAQTAASFTRKPQPSETQPLSKSDQKTSATTVGPRSQPDLTTFDPNAFQPSDFQLKSSQPQTSLPPSIDQTFSAPMQLAARVETAENTASQMHIAKPASDQVRRSKIDLNTTVRAAVNAGADAPTELMVAGVTFCKAVTGFGQYEPFSSNVFPVDQDVLIYCELENFVSEPVTDNGQRFFESEIQGGYSILNSDRRIVHHHTYTSVRDLARRKRRDFYMYFPATIPNLPPGEYMLKLDLQDLKGEKFGTNRRPMRFTIK